MISVQYSNDLLQNAGSNGTKKYISILLVNTEYGIEHQFLREGKKATFEFKY
jgi:hypothetical protein